MNIEDIMLNEINRQMEYHVTLWNLKKKANVKKTPENIKVVPGALSFVSLSISSKSDQFI